MHIVMGATGHVGSAVAMALIDRGEEVTVVTREAHRAESFASRGASVAVADVHDAARLKSILDLGETAFLLMPPADPSTDTVAEEHRSVASIASALASTHLRKIVVESTYGAQPGEAIGDLGVLYDFEQAVRAAGRPTSVIRAAYYMSNWDSALETARTKGIVHTVLPVDFVLPMVAPADLGRVAARLLTDEAGHTGVRYVEGPQAYSPADVARVFAQTLGHDVRAVATPRSEWTSAFRAMGFSPAAADSYARMTAVTVDGAERVADAERGPTTLAEYVRGLVGGE